MTKAQKVLKQARQIATRAATWADLSNALFDPYEGIVTKAFPAAADRSAFAKMAEYQEIRRLLAATIEQSGIEQGATPKKSGRFVVRLPSSMHAALEAEARREGVSLNQLVVAKLAFQLHTISR